MNTINRKKSLIAAVGAAVTAAAVPAFLFAGAGTAQAYTGIYLTPDLSGVTVHITSVGFGLVPHGDSITDIEVSPEMAKASMSSGNCTYSAKPNNPSLDPVFKGFQLPAGGTADLHFPGIPTYTTWDVTVHCPNAGIDSPTQQLVY